MGGGGKGGTTTSSQTVSIPPEVLARYNAVNAQAETVAQQPFQQYGGEFVAPLTPTQVAGTNATNAASSQAQPYYGAATALTLGGAQNVGPLTQGQIGYYQNPYTQAVVNPTVQALQQQQGQQLSQQQAEAIKGGAFGGDRANLQRSQLQGQQNLALGQAIAPLYQQGYGQAVQTAQGQQGVIASDLARQMQAGQQVAGLGTAAQAASLQGAQAQLAAGQVGQQTQQAQDTAQYQQFLQERGYPFQVAQFLANIAMGTGALSGSTTSGTQTSPGGFFSDKRLKNDVKEIGETHDGQPIYSYKYNGDDRTQIGLMAQDVEKKHPDAVGLMGGYKTVDYKKATEGAERTHKDMGGGLMPDGFDPNSMGGAVTMDMAGEGFERGGYVGGGLVDSNDWASIVAANKQALGMYGGQQAMGGAPGATGIVPAATIPVPKPIEAAKMSMPAQRPSGLSTAMQTGKDISSTYNMGKAGLIGSAPTKEDPTGSAGLIGGQGEWGGKNLFSKAKELFAADGGLIVPRHAYADGGSEDSQGDEAVPYDPSDVMGSKDPMEGVLKAGSQKHELLKPAQMQTSGGGGGGSSLGLGKMAGSAIGTAIGGPIGGMFGSMAGSLLPFAGGGLVPRQGYAEGGSDVPADYSPEADMPSPNAQEAARYSEEDLDRAARDALALQMRRESGGDSQAKAKTSSAAGMYQITNPTAKGLIARNPQWGIEYQDVPHFAATLSPEQQQTLGLGLSKEHVRTLANQGFEPTPQNVSANWFLGGGGGPAFLKAMQTDPSMPATSAAGQDQIRANPTMFFKQDGSPRSVSEVYSMLNKTGGGAPVPPGLVGAGMQPASTSGAGEKKGLVDTVTSEGFLVPALGFLGSMLASDKRNLGQALGEGIMGGVGAYQSQRKMAADIPKTEAQTKLELANVGHVNMVTRSLRAGMLVPTWQQGVGMTVFDKENPYAAPMRITDKNGIPLPGHEQVAKEGFDQLKQRGEGPAGAAGTQPGVAPVGDVTDIAKIIPKPADVNSWNPTTKVPENFMPENQGDLMRKDYVTGDLTPRGKAALDEGKKITSELREKALTSEPRMIELKRIIQEYDSLPKSGFLTTGAGASERNALIGRANVILKAIGGTEIDPNAVGAAEAAQKGTFTLGSTVANSIGTREPGYIVAQAVKNSPGIEMSKKGFDLVSSGLEQNAEYAKDRSRFYNDYFNKFHHIEGADIAFEHANPAQMYADRAMLNTIPEDERANLRNYVTQNKTQFPTAVANNIRDFERAHGRGTAKLVLGSK